MTAPNRLDWQDAASAGATVQIGMTIAGIRQLFLFQGSLITAVDWTIGVDPAFFPARSVGLNFFGDQDVLPVIEPRDITYSFRARPNGPVDVAPVNLVLSDAQDDFAGTSHVVTALFASRDILPRAILGVPVTTFDTTLYALTTTGFPMSGFLWLGREVVQYTGLGTGVVGGITYATFTGCTRGHYGTAVTAHAINLGQSGSFVYGGLQSLKGRRVVLWALRCLPDQPQTCVDPTYLAEFRCGSGSRITSDGSKWQLGLLSVLRSMTGRQNTQSIMLSGFRLDTGADVPGMFSASTIVPVTNSPTLLEVWAGSIQNGGGLSPRMFLGTGFAGDVPDFAAWVPDLATFLSLWNNVVADLITSAGAHEALDAFVLPDGHLRVQCAGNTAAVAQLLATWDAPGYYTQTIPGPEASDTATNWTWTSQNPCPTAFQYLASDVFVAAVDYARIPEIPPAPVGLAAGTSARWALAVPLEAAFGGTAYASIEAMRPSGGGASGILTCTLREPYPAPSATPPDLAHARATILAPTAATLGLWVSTLGPAGTSGTWWDAFSAYAQALDAAGLGDGFTDAFDDVDIRAQLARYAPPPGFATSRAYFIPGDANPWEVFSNEATFAGFVAAPGPSGRISLARFADLASTEPLTITLTAAEIADGDRQTATYASDNVITRVTYDLGPGGKVIFVDQAAADEVGPGGEITCTVPGTGTPLATLAVATAAVQVLAPQVLSAWRAEYITVRWPTTLRWLGAAYPGATWRVTDWLVPWRGQRGLGADGVAATLTVLGVAVTFYGAGGVGGVVVDLRVSSGAGLVGYAPEMLVGAISGGGTGPALTGYDPYTGTSTGRGFAIAGTTDCGASTFSPGDLVALINTNTNAPVASDDAVVLSTGPGAVVTLTAGVPAGWAARLAAEPLSVTLVYRAYSAATNPGQHAHAFIADTALALGGSDVADAYGSGA